MNKQIEKYYKKLEELKKLRHEETIKIEFFEAERLRKKAIREYTQKIVYYTNRLIDLGEKL